MVENQKFTRVDTLELKTVMYRKLGHLRSEKYFDLLKRFFSCKLGKCDFDKSCVRIIGKDNLSLHNQLIQSILKNTFLAQVPPLRAKEVEGSVNLEVANSQLRNGLQSIYSEAFPPSPRKGRSRKARGRKFQERPSPLGPLGKSPNFSCEEVVVRTNELQSPAELISPASRPPVEVVSVEDGEEVEQANGTPGIQSRSPVTAPLGISMKSAHKTIYCGSLHKVSPLTCEMSGELPDTLSLRKRLEQKLETEGLNISGDGVNLLNNGLNCYLKKLMEPCIRLAASRSGKEQIQQLAGHSKHTQRPANAVNVSMLDFCVAIGSKPQILGEDWAIQLEKISSRAFGE